MFSPQLPYEQQYPQGQYPQYPQQQPPFNQQQNPFMYQNGDKRSLHTQDYINLATNVLGIPNPFTQDLRSRLPGQNNYYPGQI